MPNKKKTYKEINGTTRVGDFLRKIGKSDLAKSIVTLLPSQGVLGGVKELLTKDNSLTPAEKDMALELLKIDLQEQEAVTKRWEADMASDSWLSKNVRPITLVFFSVSYVVGWYLDYSLDTISGVVSLIIGAYFGGRSIEKYNKIKK
jgi:hypothetical protein